MAVDFYPTSTPAGKIEDILYNMTDGIEQFVAVEVFDDGAMAGEDFQPRFSSVHGCEIGPWIIGPPADVYGWLESEEIQEYSEQYGVGGVPVE